MSGQLWPLPATVLLVMLLPDYAAVRYASGHTTQRDGGDQHVRLARVGGIQPVDSAARFKR